MKPSLVAASAAVLLMGATSAAAQITYTAIDLTPAGSHGVALAANAGRAAGYVSTTLFPGSVRAALWSGLGLSQMHPALVEDPSQGVQGRSTILGYSGQLQVGWAAGPATGGRTVAVAWNDTAASARILPVPFPNAYAQAGATDGTQIAGHAVPYNRDGTTTGAARALLWNVATGAVVDLGDGGRGAQVLGVGGGKQAGYVTKGSLNAALWSGTAKSLVNLHPRTAERSSANATDGVRQVGYAGYDVRIRGEVAHGNHSAIYSYATVWSGTVGSEVNIHPSGFQQSIATGVSGDTIAGFAMDPARIGTPAYYHAIVWDAANSPMDLNPTLPAGFIGAQALAVDVFGNVAGVMTKADGTRHAVLWLPVIP